MEVNFLAEEGYVNSIPPNTLVTDEMIIQLMPRKRGEVLTYRIVINIKTAESKIVARSVTRTESVLSKSAIDFTLGDGIRIAIAAVKNAEGHLLTLASQQGIELNLPRKTDKWIHDSVLNSMKQNQ